MTPDYWYDQGFNIIPTIYKSKQPSLKQWKEWQENVIPKETFERWKENEFVGNNFALITGKIHRGPYIDKYLVCIDIDNKLGIDVFVSFFGEKSLEDLSQKTIVIQHEDAKDEKAHVYFIAEKPIIKRGRINGYDKDDKTIPLIEVKSDSSTYIVCPPSVHQSGYQYQIIGTNQIQVLNEEKCKKLEDDLDTIYQSYSYNYYNPSTGKFSFLTDELKRMTKTLDIDSVKHKIPNGARNNTLLAIADSLISNHFTKSRDFLKEFFFKINQKLCEDPLDEKELESIWTQASSFIKSSIDEKKIAKNNDYSKSGDSQTKEDSNKKEYTVYKLTLDNKIYESVIIAGKPFFITIGDRGELLIIDKIEQETRVLGPPYLEEYPSKPYVFENKEEIENLVRMIKEKGISIDQLFWKIKELVSKFIVHHGHILDYISSLILFSYSQDKFSTIPYTMFVSDGGNGKSTIGNVFEDLGYRCVNMTDPTTANLFRIFGNVEAGQCTLVLDEAEKIDQDRDMMSILKNGYEYGKRVQRTNQFGKQEHFHTFGLKVLSAERSPNPSQAKGVIDRTFIVSNYKGKPQYDIKEIRKPKTPKHKRIYEEIEFLKKSLFVYRLVHFNDEIADIETGLEGRDKELCKPMLQIFYNTRSQKRIERIFEILLDEKNDRKANSLERDVLEVVASLFKIYPNGVVPFYEIWNHLADLINGSINEFKQHEMETDVYGTIYKIKIVRMLRDKFGAKDPRTRNSNTRVLEFDIDKIKNHLESYRKETPTRISCYQKVSDSNDSNDSNRKDLHDTFFSFDPSSLMNNEENNADFTRQTIPLSENFSYNNNENNTKGFPRTVTAVTAVTSSPTANPPEHVNYNKNDSMSDNLYRLYEKSDRWGCKNCTDNGDKWYMLKHNCKMNRK